MEKIQEKKKERLQIRLTSSDKKSLQIKADKLGISVSNFLVNSALNKKISTPLSEDELEMFREIKQLQNNLIRVANYINKSSPLLASEIRNIKESLKETLNKYNI